MYKLAIFVALGLLAVATAQTPNEHDCRICEFILAIAERHFRGNITDQGALQAQLLTECGHIANTADQTTCKAIVNNNIAKIYADLVAGDRIGQTCVDINYCTAAETGFPTRGTRMPEIEHQRVRRQAPNEHDCRICEFILAIAERHFRGNITDQGALQAQLLTECGHIANTADQTTCKAIVNNNIAKIYSDLVAGDRIGQTCVDINYCTAAETGFPTRGTRMPNVNRRVKRQQTESPRRECEECDRLIGYAEYWFHRNPNATQAQLQAELEHECSRRPKEQQACDQFVDSNIATIYADLKAGKRPRQTCEDLGVCPTRAPTAFAFAKH